LWRAYLRSQIAALWNVLDPRAVRFGTASNLSI
jgi:hypothetical protein